MGADRRAEQFIPLEKVIAANLSALFPGMEIAGSNVFRVTRYSDLELSHAEEPEDLLAMIEEQVFQRRFAEVVRVEIQDGMPPELRRLLLDELQEDQPAEISPLTEADVVENGTAARAGRPDDAWRRWIFPSCATRRSTPSFHRSCAISRAPSSTQSARRTSCFTTRSIRSPARWSSSSPAAALDENVLAIKMTLYRTSGDTAIVRALTEAAKRGKQVAVLIELQARFDEANNITWARTLEGFGVHVAYGLPGLKTHTKTTLVVRREADGIRRYAHIGSGNYNSKTARTYTDIGLFTSSLEMGADLTDLFNALTGFSRQSIYRQAARCSGRHAPAVPRADRPRDGFCARGKPARIIAKMNALVDAELIEALYAASQAGVDIDLIVRGICCLRPGVPGVSDNIRVISIVGRFLEHSRLFYFTNGGQEEFYFGSADWMPRNFDRRVEAVAPIEDHALHPRLHSLLQLLLSDNRQAWVLSADGSYAQRNPDDEPEIASHKLLIGDPWGERWAAEAAENPGGGNSVRRALFVVVGQNLSVGVDDLHSRAGDFRQQARLSSRSPEVEANAPRAVIWNGGKAQRAARPSHLDSLDRAGVTSVEAVCHPQDRRQPDDRVAHLFVEVAEVDVAALRLAPAMIARDVGDDDLVGRSHAEQLGVLDEMI